MSGSIVNVLTPNGRRQNVKVQPNTAILKVLEDVCEKHKFDPNEYDLKHHKRILDLTTSFRFSGLPNNAQLEMVEAQKKRQDCEVELVVQFGEGNRVDGKFKPNTTMLMIIEQLCPQELTGDDLFSIYMRTEVTSDKLENTTLRDLGLISGRAIIRLVHRDPNAAKIQSNVALNLIKPNETKAGGSGNRQNNELNRNSTFAKVLAEERLKQQSKESTENERQEEISTKSEEQQEMVQESKSAQRHTSEQPSQSADRMEFDTPEPSHVDEDPGEIHILGERSAVLFTQDAAESANSNELPDTFFDLSVRDIKLLIKGLRTEAEGTIEQPLMTAKLREMEDEQKQLSMLNKYKTVIIRIQFPNRYVLQGTFTPYETIENIMDFVRSYLTKADMDFYLYTTPPKKILPKESRLFEADCVPSAILHFGSDEKQENYLKEDILQKVSSPKASLFQALADRGLEQTSETSDSASKDDSGPSSSLQVRRANAVSYSASSGTSTSGGDTKLPKWLKPFGK